MDLRTTRRELLAGLGALAIAPAAPAGAPLTLRAILDEVAAAGDPGAMLALVRRVRAGGLDPAGAAILRMVTRGLEREAALRRAFPFGKADSPLELESSVRRMSPADKRSGRRGYRDLATAAGPGAYYPDLHAVHERPSWTLTPVVFHETVPGHLLQLGRQERADPHPLQIRYAPGYSEGWAIYAEALVGDMGWPPADRVGFIQSRLFRLARVRCDIGIHLRRWDRARALRYLEETVGFELFFPFAVEVDRYAAEPASFAGDAMVALTLRRLGRKAAASGRLRDFHDRVLNRGPLSAEAIGRIT